MTHNTPSEINLLIGADIFFQLLLPVEQPPQSSTTQPKRPTTEAPQAATPRLQAAHAECSGHGASQASRFATNEVQPNILYTKLGLVIGGSLPVNTNKENNKYVSLICLNCETNINETVTNFWKTESVPELLCEQSSEQETAETIFQSSVKLEENKFQVDLPLKVPLKEETHSIWLSTDSLTWKKSFIKTLIC